MTRVSTLRYDRGTLILDPPPKGRVWLEYATWDDRITKFRIPAHQYRSLVEALRHEGTAIVDKAPAFQRLELSPQYHYEPRPEQAEALTAWQRAGRRGVVVLPTGAGKTHLAQLAMECTPRSSLIVVPTLDLLQQWYADLEAVFPGADIGLLGGGSKDESDILVATYDSAAIFAEMLGNRYGLLIFDECHHLPSDFYRVIAEYSLAPYRLGLSATPERSDGKHEDLRTLIGPLVYRKAPEDLAGGTLADHKVIRIKVALSADERKRYDEAMTLRNTFLQDKGIRINSLKGWQLFVAASARSQQGRAAMLAHREARQIAFGTEGKLRVLENLLSKHQADRLLVFTDDNAAVYAVSKRFLIPAITHQTKVKERHESLQKFREGTYPRIVTSRVLNEGVDVPEANVAVVLSGTSTTREYVQRLGRILRRGEGKLALLYEVIAEDTREEVVSLRRRGELKTKQERDTQLSLEPIAQQGPLAFEDL